MIPPLDLAERGTVITITGTSDEIDGDTSSANALRTRPGPDRHISIDEAIDVTNRSPGTYTIRFAPDLKGASIGITHPHSMTGGNVFLNGDIDGDGKPDVTLTSGRPGEYPALVIASGGNRINALVIDGINSGIHISPPEVSRTTFTSNVLSNNVINADIAAIALDSQAVCDGPECAPAERNRWVDLRILGNTLSAREAGFKALLSTNAGNALDGLIVARNTIRMGERAANLNPAIEVVAGILAGADSNRIERVLIAENVVENAVNGIWVAAGMAGGSRNVVDDVRVVANRVGIVPLKDAGGIALLVGDGASDEYSTAEPVIHGNGNSMTDVSVEGNFISKPGLSGVQTMVGCCGGEGNVMERVRIEGNEIDALLCNGCQGKGIWIAVAFAAGRYSRLTHSSTASDIKIAHNTVRLPKPADWPQGANLREPLNIPFAGISVEVASHASKSVLTDLEISSNLVTTEALGIAVLGGWNRGYDPFPTEGNAGRGIWITCDVVTTRPSLEGLGDLRGVTVIGGGRSASVTGNSLDVTVKDTLVVDKLNDITVIENLEQAVGNKVQIRKE